MLVERIAVSYWRLARVLRAETGAIRAGLDDLPFDAEQRASEREEELRDEGVPPAERMRDVPGIDSLLVALEQARAEFENRGYLVSREIENFEQVVGYVFGGMEQPIPKLSRSDDAARRAQVLACLDSMKGDLEIRREQLVQKERLDEGHRRRVLAVPSEAMASRLLRYEGAIERQFYRALHELERLQRMRAGEPVPPHLHVQVEATE